MKFEIEISEELIQSRLDHLAGHSVNKGYGIPSFDLRAIINQAVLEALKLHLAKSLIIPDSINKLIDAEIQKAAEKKVPGWAARRMKEMLDAVRLAQISPDLTEGGR